MQVEIRHQISGLRDGKPWPVAGEVVDLPDDEAVQLLRDGIAKPVEQAEPETASLKN